MKQIKKYAYVCLLLFLSSMLWAADTSPAKTVCFKTISPQGGYSSTQVTAIRRDQWGSIWIGTNQGLFRRTANKTTHFTQQSDNTSSLNHSQVNDICVDTQNRLWIATEAGLCLYNRDQNNFYRVAVAESNHEKIAVKQLLFANNRLILLKEKQLQSFAVNSCDTLTLKASLSIIGLTCFARGPDQSFWLGTHNGLIYQYDQSLKQRLQMIHIGQKINCIGIDSNYVLIGTEGNGLFRYNMKTRQTKPFALQTPVTHTSAKYIRTLQFDSKNRMWIGTYCGLFLIKGTESKHFCTADYSELGNNSIYELNEDSDENLWIGTWNGGVSVLPRPNQNATTKINYDSSRKRQIGKVTTIQSITNHSYLIGTEQKGLFYFDRNQQNLTSVPIINGKNITNIKCLARDRNNGQWVGTFREGLFYKPDEQSNFKQIISQEETQFPLNSIYALCPCDSGMWIGSGHHGLFFYSFKRKLLVNYFSQHKTLQTYSNKTIRCMLLDRTGNLWLGFIDGEIAVLQLKNNTFRPIKEWIPTYRSSFKSVHCFLEDHLGRVWIGTKENGILTVPKSLSLSDHLSHLRINNIKNIAKNHSSNTIWISSSSRLCRYNTQTDSLEQIINRGNTNESDFTPNSIEWCNERHLLIGTATGIIDLNPNFRQSTNPRTAIEKICSNNKNVKYPHYNSQLKIAPLHYTSSATVLMFHFCVDNPLSTQSRNYQYKLLPIQSKWKNTENNGIAIVTDLEPGNYLFEVRGCNNNGVWSSCTTQVPFSIERNSFWQISVILTSVLFLVTMLFFFRKRRKASIITATNRMQKPDLTENKEQHNFFIKAQPSQHDCLQISPDNEFIQLIIRIVLEHIEDENFTLHTLAQLLKISRSSLHRKLKQVTGRTPSQLVTEIRLQRAIELVHQKRYKLYEVAFHVGFSSQSYFNRCFKKQYGVTPRQYFDKYQN